MLGLAGLPPLAELRVCEGGVGDELRAEDALLLAVPQPQPHVSAVLHHAVHLRRKDVNEMSQYYLSGRKCHDLSYLRCLTNVHDLRDPVHRNVPLLVVADPDPHEAAHHGLLEDGEVDKLIQLES